MSKWSSMKKRVESYLHTRRSVGYNLHTEGAQLQRFACFADKQDHQGHITIDLAVDWANNTLKSNQIGRARRFEVVRSLAKYCVTFEPETEIPPPHLLGPAHRRPTPYIYTDQEITLLLDMANGLQPQKGLRPATMHCLLGLLASTGLRISEALRLNRNDVDLHQGVLKIRETKFRKSRYVPVHQMVCEALSNYATFRDQRLPVVDNPIFFLLDNGKPFQYRQVLYAFHCIRAKLGWDTCLNGFRPRLYDLRHTFVCKRLLTWYKKNADIDHMLPLLSTYLGHAKVSDTYWYLTGIPELMAIAVERFEQQSHLNSMRGAL
ncbi:tyrosine-type recombinase/integrase [Desulfotignum balticum]|uniref:tyrosine-type recombinase/integrase n=1 Tax=Desulfotignum balticum TaxID=115781 RepID=UPI0003FD5562|nr:tyrosine-type recombinase/integrase [Desulfotignum balticum]